MKYENVKYGILLTREQLDFLKNDNQGFHRMKAFDTFISLAAIEPFHYEKKNFSADLGIGQFTISKVELAELWHCDRKTAQKMIDHFNEVGILTSVANNRTTVHTIHCISSWLVNGQQTPIRNPHYMRTPPYRFRYERVRNNKSVMLPVALTETDGNISMHTISGTGSTEHCNNDKSNVVAIDPVNADAPAVQDNANTTSYNDNDNSHPQSLTSNNLVSSMADANNDEREENMLSPCGEDGQLPEDYLKHLDEHYANLLPEADEPYSISSDFALGNTPSMLTNQEDIHIDEGSTSPAVSPSPNIAAVDAPDNAESSRYGSD